MGTIVSFRVGAEDAEYLEKEFIPEFVAGDLVNLPKYNIYLKLMINGIAGSPFSAETLPPFPKLEKSNREKIIKVSRERYGTPRKIVEEKIAKWTGNLELPATPSTATPILYDARCSLCGKDTKVIFPPTPSRPVYCKSCLKKIKKEKEVPTQNKTPTISLREAAEKEPVPFSFKKTEETKKPKRLQPSHHPEVNLKELKKTLEESLREVKRRAKKDEKSKGI
jgi:CxxC-x17-CxxC domain-containing protein